MVSSSIELVWNIFITLFLLGSSSLLYIISYWGFKDHNLHSGFSTIVCAILLTLFGIHEIVIGLFSWPFGPLFLIFSLFFTGMQMVFIFIRKKHLMKNPIDPKSYKGISNDNFSPKHELFRKLFHFAGILIPVGYYWVFPLLNQLILTVLQTSGGQIFYETLWGDASLYPYLDNDLNASGELLHFTLWCGLSFMIVFDIVRIFTKPEYSIFPRLLQTVLREKEVVSVGPQVLLFLGTVTSFFGATLGWFPYEIAVSGTLTACIADGIVAVLGKRFGKHKFRVFNREQKSIEGFIIGFISSYLCSMIIIGPFYALFAAIIFVILDVFSTPIADNLLNPIFLTFGVWGVSSLINIPIGWGV